MAINNHTIIIFDWIGSILMLGSLWGWIYGKMSPAIKGKLKRSERRLKAAVRLLTNKYGENFSKNDAWNRYVTYRKTQGIRDDASLWAIAAIKYQYLRKQEWRRKAGLINDEEHEIIHQNYLAAATVISLFLPWLFRMLAYQSQLTVFRIVDVITLSVFSGKIGRALFILGFVLWNLSKVLSLYLARN